MDFIVKLLASLAGIVGGVLMMKYNYQLTRLFGYNEYAERLLGQAGTYSMWKIIGVTLVVGSLLYLIS